MGFSEWWHVDFRLLTIKKEGPHTTFIVDAEDGKVYRVPKSKVAHYKDYKSGDKNGCISIKEKYAEDQGWIKT